MVLSLTSTLSLFVLIALSTAVFFAAKRFKLPYTVLLVAIGILLVPIVNLPYLSTVFGFLDDLVLTPELLFYIFLPVLIFESGFNMNIRKIVDNAWAISMLAAVSAIISTAVIGGLLYLALPLIGHEVPLILTLIFGAAISSTDPATILSVLKRLGVPRRLSMIFEGESLLNDGTTFAMFLIMLSVATAGFHGAETVLKGGLNFIIMTSSGVLFGLIMAAAFSHALRLTKSNEFATVTLLVISAHLVFIITEAINELGYFRISPMLATAVASLFLGNYARDTLAPKVDDYLGKLIEHMAFIAKSLVFLLAGLLFANSGVNLAQLWLPIAITVLVVAAARMISVYAVILPLNKTKLEEPIPSAWTKLIAWGSLRGVLTIIYVLLIPENFTLADWNYPYSPRDFLVALTIGCILATMFIKAPLIGPMMRRYNIREFDPLKTAHECDLGIYYLQTERNRLLNHKQKGFISDDQYKHLLKEVEQKLATVEHERRKLIGEHGLTIFVQSLHLAMVHVEIATLKRLYINDELNEAIYRKIRGKLDLQREKIEYAQHNSIDPVAYIDRKDVFDRLMNFMRTLFTRSSPREMTLEERLKYYRAQMIMARKAVTTIARMQHSFDRPVFLRHTYEEVSGRYRTYREQSARKMNALVEKNRAALSPVLAELAERTLSTSGIRALGYLHENGLVNETDQEDIRHRFDI